MYLTFLSWSHFHVIFLDSMPSLFQLFSILAVITHSFCDWMSTMPEAEFSKIVKLLQSNTPYTMQNEIHKRVRTWAICLFVFSVAILSYKIMLCLVFIAPVNVPNYFGIIYQDHLWYFKCRYTYVFLYLFKNSFLSDKYYYLMMIGRGLYICISYILELNIKANNVANNKSK